MFSRERTGLHDVTLQRIAIHGVPRSGTTWLGEILNSNEQVIYKYQPLFSYALKSFLDEHSDLPRIDEFFSRLTTTEDDFLDQRAQRERGDLPCFNKLSPSHIVYKEVRYHNILENLLAQDQSVKLIGLVRNPLAAMASWLAAPREFRRDLGWDQMAEWRAAPSKNQGLAEEFYGFDKWKEAANLFHKLAAIYPERVKITAYSELLAEPEEQAQQICQFAGLEFTEQMRVFIAASRSETKADTYSVYRQRQKDDGWQSTIDDRIVQAIRADLDGSDLARYLEE